MREMIELFAAWSVFHGPAALGITWELTKIQNQVSGHVQVWQEGQVFCVCANGGDLFL